MWNRFLESTHHEYSPSQRLVLLFFAGILFLILVPLALIYASAALDRWLGLEPFGFGWRGWNVVAAIILILTGWPLGLWANYVQFTLGRGTPVPLMATQKLIISGPYRFCRNPMALGAFIAYFGVALWIGSLSALALVVLFVVLLTIYIKTVEEREMEARFGEEYLEYRRRTPFIIPRTPK